MQKILIVEDDPDIAAIERDYLELNGCQVEIAADGEAGLALGLGGGFDLILLDLMLPGVDGFTVCRKLRERIDTQMCIRDSPAPGEDSHHGPGETAPGRPLSPGVQPSQSVGSPHSSHPHQEKSIGIHLQAGERPADSGEQADA